MSIWCSWPGVGHNDHEPQRGEVRSYAEGWSNHFPTVGDAAELPATVDVAHIAPWCVPGHDECGDCDGTHVGPWLRLTLHADKAKSWWDRTTGDEPGVRAFTDSVVMDRAAVEALAADLGRWLALEHVEASS